MYTGFFSSAGMVGEGESVCLMYVFFMGPSLNSCMLFYIDCYMYNVWFRFSFSFSFPFLD